MAPSPQPVGKGGLVLPSATIPDVSPADVLPAGCSEGAAHDTELAEVNAEIAELEEALTGGLRADSAEATVRQIRRLTEYRERLISGRQP